MGIVSLILGILATVFGIFCLVPGISYYGWIGIVLGVAGIVLAALANKKEKKGINTAWFFQSSARFCVRSCSSPASPAIPHWFPLNSYVAKENGATLPGCAVLLKREGFPCCPIFIFSA